MAATLDRNHQWSVYVEPDRSVSSHPSAQAEFYYFLTEEGARHFGAIVASLGHLWILRQPASELHRSDLAWRKANEKAAHDAALMYPDEGRQKQEIPKRALREYRRLMFP